MCIAGCRSQQRVIATGDVFYNQCYPIESFYVPSCRLDLSIGNQSFSLNGSIFICPDSVFYFRGRMLMIEAVRGAIYRDSFVVVSYIERVYYTGRNDFLQRITGFPINPESLLMLFTADRCENVYRNKFNFEITALNRGDRILMHDQNRNVIELTINHDEQTIENITMSNNQQRQPLFSAAYSGYEQHEQFKLPTSLNISINDGAAPIRVRANYQQILLNQPMPPININIPSSFRLVVLE
jgi:hypothetical protein